MRYLFRTAVFQLFMHILYFSFDFLCIFSRNEFGLDEFQNGLFCLLVHMSMCINFWYNILIFFLELKNRHIVISILLFSLDKVEIPLITLFEDWMFEWYHRLVFLLVFLKFVEIIHVELNMKNCYLPDEWSEVAMTKVLRKHYFFHLFDVRYDHSFSFLVPVYYFRIFLHYSMVTSIISRSLHTN